MGFVAFWLALAKVLRTHLFNNHVVSVYANWAISLLEAGLMLMELLIMTSGIAAVLCHLFSCPQPKWIVEVFRLITGPNPYE